MVTALSTRTSTIFSSKYFLSHNLIKYLSHFRTTTSIVPFLVCPELPLGNFLVLFWLIDVCVFVVQVLYYKYYRSLSRERVLVKKYIYIYILYIYQRCRKTICGTKKRPGCYYSYYLFASLDPNSVWYIDFIRR